MQDFLNPAALFLQLAWRNIWRNKRRSLLLLTSVALAVLVAVIFTSAQIGQNEYLVNLTVGMFTGHIQIHQKGYWNQRTLDYTMELSAETYEKIANLPTLSCTVPRLETFVLLSHGTVTKIASFIGAHPAREEEMTHLSSKLIGGTYFTDTSRYVLLAEGLARTLKVTVGDSIVLYGQGYQGNTVAAVVPVGGIVRFPTPDLNTTFLFVPLPYAQELLSAPNRLTSVSLLLKNSQEEHSTLQQLHTFLSSEYEVLTWHEMLPELVQIIDVNNGGTFLMLLILYVVIGFGIFGTIIMMTLERTREFGILISIGMHRARLISVCAIESLFLSSVGAAVGIALALPLVWYFTLHPIQFTGDYAKAMLAYGMEPILPLSIDPIVFLVQVFTIVGIALLCTVYPLLVIRSLDPVRATRSL